MSDLINRQAAIDALSEAGLINYAATGDGNGMIHAVNVIKGLPSAQTRERLVVKIDVSEKQIRDALEKMRNEPVQVVPSAQPVWIPCSERLPEGFGEYLVTKKTIGWKCVEYNSIDIAYFDNDGFHKADKALAWMPLPAPYGGDERDV